MLTIVKLILLLPPMLENLVQSLSSFSVCSRFLAWDPSRILPLVFVCISCLLMELELLSIGSVILSHLARCNIALSIANYHLTAGLCLIRYWQEII